MKIDAREISMTIKIKAESSILFKESVLDPSKGSLMLTVHRTVSIAVFTLIIEYSMCFQGALGLSIQ